MIINRKSLSIRKNLLVIDWLLIEVLLVIKFNPNPGNRKKTRPGQSTHDVLCSKKWTNFRLSIDDYNSQCSEIFMKPSWTS